MRDFTKLPKWAQEQLTQLERTLAERDAEIAALTANNPKSNVAVCARLFDNRPIYLHDNDTVRFFMGPEGREIDVRRDGKQLVVHARGVLIVKPQASNAVHLETT